MHDVLIQRFRDEVLRSFGFLAAEHGFRGPEYESRFDGVVARYLGRTLAVELELHTVPGVELACYVARIVDGEVTRHFAVDGERRLVRFRLASWVEYRLGRAPRLAAIRAASAPEELAQRIEHEAGLLRSHGHEVLADSAAVFRS
jgi:hypothetical protein